MTCGIYMIKNKETGQMYIGQSIDILKEDGENIVMDIQKNIHILIELLVSMEKIILF